AEWKFTISDTPLSYTSREQFETTFSSVTVSGGDFSNARIAAGTQANSFIATGDDLEGDDYMSWGTWSISLLYDDDYNQAKDQTRDVYGFWVAGEPTDAAIVDALVGSAVSYDGKYRAIDFLNNNTVVNGTADMMVDFGADTATLNIDYDSGRTFDMDIAVSGNSMTGWQSGGEYGVADGTFYGPNGDSIGGNFKTTYGAGSGVEIKGVYQVDK
ncbi:MAG: transferrin-binding protein-like solute binding protein, partial [Campylobacterota bacterium]|nr:transferrin-binding protein-like solute binding protein [Campylobacterota bacterium]